MQRKKGRDWRLFVHLTAYKGKDSRRRRRRREGGGDGEEGGRGWVASVQIFKIKYLITIRITGFWTLSIVLCCEN
jgi:hypothetical protein